MSLTEREKEIALECFDEYESFDNVSDRVIQMAFDKALSRIRDEQEAVAEVIEDEFKCIPIWTDAGINATTPNGMKLFTIPPATPCDCSELVEALEKIASCESKVKGDVIDIAKEALANHAKRMKGKRE